MPEGPQLWENWQAYDPCTPAEEAFEVALYSDADLFGRIDAPAWPVDLMPALPPLRAGLKLTAIARVRWNTTGDYDMTTSDTASYHGGGPADEVAALVSLALGFAAAPAASPGAGFAATPIRSAPPSRQIIAGLICLSRQGATLCSQASRRPASTL